jgi:hypothetical protein
MREYEAGKMYGFRNASRLPMDVNARLVVRRLLGPAFCRRSVGDLGHRKWYLEIDAYLLKDRHPFQKPGLPRRMAWEKSGDWPAC